LGDYLKETLLEELKDERRLCYVYPLYNLKYEGPEIVLSRGLSLMPIGNTLLLELGKSLPFIPRAFEKVTCVIKRTYHMRPDGGFWWITVVGAGTQLLIRDLLAALRLFRAGSIQLGPQIQSYWLRNWFKRNTIWGDIFYLEPRSISGMDEGVLNTSGALDFKRFWHRFRRTRPTKALRIAVLRFDLAYRNEDPEERLIDYVVALEALYTGDIQELAYKLALRAAFFLGKTKEDRNNIFHILKKAYAVRSQIVHGQEPKDEFILQTGRILDIYGLVKEVEEILRQSIKKLIDLPDLLKAPNLQESLDQIVLDSSRTSDG